MTTETISLDDIAGMIRAGRLDDACEALDGYPDTDENRCELMFLRGYLHEMSYDREAALNSYEEALEQNPEHTEACFRAAWLADQVGDTEAAIELYERCTASEPVHANAMVNLAVLYEEKGDLKRAEACLLDVLDTYPAHTRANRFLKSVAASATMVYDEHKQREKEMRNAVLDMPISDFELSVRSRNCLRQMNIKSLGDLLSTSEPELLSYKNFGETSLNEVKAMLAQKGLALGKTLPPPEQPVFRPPAPTQEEDGTHVNKLVTELELSVRSRKALQRLGAVTLSDLIVHTEAELMSIKNFGQTSLNEIQRQLARYGLSLRQTGV